MLRVIPYQLALCEPIRVGARQLSTREGCLLRLSVEGQDFVSDVSPLPGFHPESLSASLAAIRALAFPWKAVLASNRPWDLTKLLFGLLTPEQDLPVSALFAMESLLLQIHAWRQGWWPQATALASAGLISLHENPDQLAGRLARLQANGVRVLKAKLGRQSPAEDLQRLRDIHERYAGAFRFRLDAAGTLDPHDARLWEDLSHTLPIEYMEDPFPAGAEIPEAFAVPCAYDLAVDWREAAGLAAAVRCLVVKPQKVGGISGLHRECSRQRALGRRLILSHCYESEMSLPSYACLARSLGLLDETMGFGTLLYFSEGVRLPFLPLTAGAWQVSVATISAAGLAEGSPL